MASRRQDATPARAPHQWGFLTFISALFVVAGCLYCFVLGPAVRHVPAFWASPSDLGNTFRSASDLARGHVSTVYGRSGLVSFPGILLLLLPFGALSSAFQTTVVQISQGGRPLPQLQTTVVHQYLANPVIGHGGGNVYVAQPQWLLVVFPFTLVLACSALFAFDALARQLGVTMGHRRLLAVVEAGLLSSPIVETGHPEDVVAVALAVYALVYVLRGRWAPAGWLFGMAIAFQPLVLLMAPILLVVAGWPEALAFAGRSALPSAALLALPLATGFSSTIRTLLYQPNYPLVDHQTPWTALAPHLGGSGMGLSVASGPGRMFAIAAAGFIGYRARRWREDPEQLLWACAVALGLRCYTESVMDPYYTWPALALGVVLVARRSAPRYAAAIAVASATTVVSLEHAIAWLPWWLATVGGMSILLAVASPRRQPPVTVRAGVPEPALALARAGARPARGPTGRAKTPATATSAAATGGRAGDTQFPKKGAPARSRRKASPRR